MKLEFANEHCLGGTITWAMDLDNGSMINSIGKTTSMKRSQVLGDFGGIWFY